MSDLKITAGPFSFTGALERERAPKTVAAFEALLPFHSKIIHVRWSGESAWIPLGDLDIGLDRPSRRTRPATPPRPGAVVPRRAERDRDPLPLRRHAVREHRRAARGQPLPDDRGRQKTNSARWASTCCGTARWTSSSSGRNARRGHRPRRARVRAGERPRRLPEGLRRAHPHELEPCARQLGRARATEYRRDAGRADQDAHVRGLARGRRRARPLGRLDAGALRPARRADRLGADRARSGRRAPSARGSSSTAAPRDCARTATAT